MSNDTQMADQVVSHFHTKLFYLVNHARATAESKLVPKVDKWFNLETPGSDLFSNESRARYHFTSASPPPPPLQIQVLLSIPTLNDNQVLVYLTPDSTRVRIEPTPRHILLESWTLTFTPRYIDEEENNDIAPSTIYKHGISLFRSLFSLLRLMPAWKLYKRIRRRTSGFNRNGNLSIHLRVENDSDTVLGFSSNSQPLSTQSHAFPSVSHHMGTLTLSATYLTSPNFQLDELESHLSSSLRSPDDVLTFAPPLTKRRRRVSITGSTGSLPIRRPLTKSPSSSPPSRFVRPSRPASLPGAGGSPHSVPKTTSRYSLPNPSGSTSGFSMSFSRDERSSMRSREETRGEIRPSGLTKRFRQDSTGARRADVSPPSRNSDGGPTGGDTSSEEDSSNSNESRHSSASYHSAASHRSIPQRSSPFHSPGSPSWGEGSWKDCSREVYIARKLSIKVEDPSEEDMSW